MDTLCTIREICRCVARFEEEFGVRYGLCLNEGMLLCSLSGERECTAGRIAGLLGLSPSNASKVIASVERKGFVVRTMDGGDKRRVRFSLTPAGRECLASISGGPEGASATLARIRELCRG